jgi:hypothetical protein
VVSNTAAADAARSILRRLFMNDFLSTRERVVADPA